MMEDKKYPTMRRPKRKLCYRASKESQPKQWVGALTLDDVDKMFDDLGSSPADRPSSSLLQTFDIEPNHNELEISPIPPEEPSSAHRSERKMGSAKGTPCAATKSPFPKPNDGLDIPFKGHQPVKTSSPIDQPVDLRSIKKQAEEKVKVVSPVLFPRADEVNEAPSESVLSEKPSQEPQCNGQGREDSDLSGLETPPNTVILPKRVSQKKKPEASRQENPELPVIAVSQPEVEPPEKNPQSARKQTPMAKVTRPGNDLTAFLQRLKEAGQSKVARKSMYPVKVPTPEPEDDFHILEDDATFQISIPSKNAPRKQSKSSSSDKESSSERGTRKRSPQERPPSQEELKNANRKQEEQTVKQKMKKKKKVEEKNDAVTSPECDTEELLPEQQKPNKKKQRPPNVQSKESNEAESQAEDAAASETKDPSPKPKTKALKSSESRKARPTKAGKAAGKMSRTKSSKATRKEQPESDDVQETVTVLESEELNTPPENKIVTAESNGSSKQKQPPVPCESSPSEDAQAVGKRKRKPAGPWWLNSSQTTEEPNAPLPSTVKKPKQNIKKQNAAPSPVKEKKATAAASSQQTSKAKGRKTKQSQKGSRSDGATKMEAAAHGGFEAPEDEQQSEVPAAEQQQEPSSPLPFTYTEHRAESGAEIFQRVYCSHHVQLPRTPAMSGAPRPAEEHLGEASSVKRRRKPAGSWWMLNRDAAQDESVSSQLHQDEPKPHTSRKKPSNQNKLPGVPTKRRVDAPSNPPGGAAATPLKALPVFTPKTVKRSLAKFTDIFTSNVETPRVVEVTETLQNNRLQVASRPVEQKAANDSSRVSSETLDEGEGRSPEDLRNPTTPQDSTSNILVSGPASLIELEAHDENDDTSLPSSRVQTLLSVSDLCGPPLRPLTLQRQDQTNLAEWLKTLWPTPAKNSAEVSPDEFDWYFHLDKAMGLKEDVSCGPICTGKILLGSDMKKPLWVDHSATTVFNLLSSSVSVTIDGSVSHFGPGQSFIVHCGHAYSIKNSTKMPAVLFFTRILAESLD